MLLCYIYIYIYIYIGQVILNLVQDGGESSTSRPSRFTPAEITTVTHQIGGCLGPKTGQDFTSKINSIAPAGNWTSDRPAHSPVSALYQFNGFRFVPVLTKAFPTGKMFRSIQNLVYAGPYSTYRPVWSIYHWEHTGKLTDTHKKIVRGNGLRRLVAAKAG